MPLCRFQVSFEPKSNIPEDRVVNTWHFNTWALDPDDLNNVRDMLKDFYETTAPGAAQPLSYFMSNQFESTATVKAYNLAQPKPRPPIWEGTFAHAPGPTQVLPREVALVMSFQAVREAGEIQARRRNRVYIGPLNSATLEGTSSLPSAVFMTSLRCAAAELLRAADASIMWGWHTYSPTSGESHDVNNGWVDNAWDTQRRRGREATVRGTWDYETGL